MTFNNDPQNPGHPASHDPSNFGRTGEPSLGSNPNHFQQQASSPSGANFGQAPQNFGYMASPVSGQFDQTVKSRRNILAIIAFAVAVIGFIFACIPGALIVGWVLLPIAFILGIVSLFMKGKKGFGIAAIVISVIGTIVGVIVFTTLAVDAVDEALGGDEVSVQGPDGESPETQNGDNAALGSREQPLPIGSKLSTKDWAVTVNSVTLDANDQVTAENMFNDPPAPGMQYMLVNVTADYLGNDPQGASPWVSIKYLKSDGTTLDSTDTLAVAPDRFENLETVYEGASVTGNFAIQIPVEAAAEGVLAVETDVLSDTAFVAVQ